jgi:hypothetical protein
MQRWKMAENNKMADVAALFGKKLGEPFYVFSSHYKYKLFATFTSYGLIYWDDVAKDWFNTTANLINDLIRGRAVIVDD